MNRVTNANGNSTHLAATITSYLKMLFLDRKELCELFDINMAIKPLVPTDSPGLDSEFWQKYKMAL